MNDIKILKLRAMLGKNVSYRDLIDENKYWRTLASDFTHPLEDVKKDYLRGLGNTGAINDMEKQYWKAK